MLTVLTQNPLFPTISLLNYRIAVSVAGAASTQALQRVTPSRRLGRETDAAGWHTLATLCAIRFAP
jgi:hypothetical protein